MTDIFEMTFDRKRLAGLSVKLKYDEFDAPSVVRLLIIGMLDDCIANGGELAVVVDSDEMTVLQRNDYGPTEEST